MTSHRDLPFKRYLELLDTYGADLERWPAEERTPAKKLIVESAPARQARQEAETLDRLLNRAFSIEPSDVLKARIRAIPEGGRSSGASERPGFVRILGPALALAAAALLGIAAGSLAYGLPGQDVDAKRISGDDMTSDDWEELTDLAFAANLDSEDWP